MARHKIPVVASPRASFEPHGLEGRLLLAHTNNAFCESLKILNEHPETKHEIAEKAFDYVMSSRLDHHAAAKWAEVLEAL
jgi:hypothetical protein